jgi:hypothetical protein
METGEELGYRDKVPRTLTSGDACGRSLKESPDIVLAG